MSIEVATTLPNLSLATRRLPPPQDIKLEYTKVSGQSIIIWDNLRGADHKVFYNVYRAMAYNGIFYKLNKSPIPINRFIDNTCRTHPTIGYWYKVSSCYLDNDIWIEGTPSEPIQYQAGPATFWLNKINERNLWILKNDGLIFDFYARKYDGEKCSCYDYNRASPALGDCPICYGTGYVGGYAPTCALLVRIVNTVETLNQTKESYRFSQTPTAWTISPIRIRNRDLLIHPDGTIYQVLDSTVSSAAGFQFHQDLKLSSLENNDPLYKIRHAHLKLAY